jgi:hypothetical protein
MIIDNGDFICNTRTLVLLWWLLSDSNRGHKALQASALPTELKSHDQASLQIKSLFFKIKTVTYSKDLMLFRHKVFDRLDSIHKLSREDDRAILLNCNVAQHL